MANYIIPTITNDGRNASVFSTREIELQGDPVRMLSEQQDCVNFRLRTSTSDFASDFHVAGDPTLLIILAGTIRISLLNETHKDFSAGDMFIAEDYLLPNLPFDRKVHGHSAKVQGEIPVTVLHLKLEKRS